jgi:hypothetical protein
MISDADLINAVTGRHPNTARTYRVLVNGRMGQSAWYTVAAATQDDARRLAREYATRIDRDTFRGSYPRVSYATREVTP